MRATLALADSGSDDDLIARPLARAFGFRVKDTPIGEIKGLNGDPGPLWGVVKTVIQITDFMGQRKSMKRRLFIMDMPGIDLILGMPWFEDVNPIINWVTKEWRFPYGIDFDTMGLKRVNKIPRGRVAFALTINEIYTKPSETLEIPREYAEYSDTFSEEMADELPPISGKTHVIDTDNKEPPYGPIYALSKTELKTLREYLDSSLKKG